MCFADTAIPLTSNPDTTKFFNWLYDNVGNRTDYDIGDPPPTSTTDYASPKAWRTVRVWWPVRCVPRRPERFDLGMAGRLLPLREWATRSTTSCEKSARRFT